MEGQRATTAARMCWQSLETIYRARPLRKTHLALSKNTSLNFAPPAARHRRGAGCIQGGAGLCFKGRLSTASPPSPRRFRGTPCCPPQLPRRRQRALRATPSSRPGPSRCPRVPWRPRAPTGGGSGAGGQARRAAAAPLWACAGRAPVWAYGGGEHTQWPCAGQPPVWACGGGEHTQ